MWPAFGLVLVALHSVHSAIPPPSAIQAFASSINGSVLTANDAGFAQRLVQCAPLSLCCTSWFHSLLVMTGRWQEIDNSRCVTVPVLFVLPLSTADVALSLQFAQTWTLPFVVKSGGHSAACYSLVADGLVLDMVLLNTTIVDTAARTFTVQAGARWEDVYAVIAPTNLVPVGGGCVTVSPSGFTLGGGFSFVSRSHGLSIDNLLAMTLVTASGTVCALFTRCVRV
jgi:FAD/FMN-containing dehydrogenase